MKKAKELQSVDPKTNFPRLEEDVLNFWEEKAIFTKSLEKTKGKKPFRFLEGPPTANGKPGIHHALARIYKDVYLRYKTMEGYYVDRKAGWDTHGLPVEIQVEKTLGISGKPQIETLKDSKKDSIAFFNQECQKSVWQYKKDFETFTERIGYWIDMTYPYITYENTYMESLWWIIKQVWDRGLFYQGYKVVLHCPRCGTSLSSHEVAQGYRDIDETSVYIQFPIKNQKNTYILAWTTTPWTLPGNVALAVDKNIDYIKIELESNKHKLILAKARLGIIQEKYHILETFKGSKLVGLEYQALFNINFDKKAHFVTSADFVTVDDGTGVVHTAVMYGEEDYNLGKSIGLPEKHTVDEAGKFTKDVPGYAGKFVHDSNSEIISELKNKGLVYKTENTRHSYPFCWRCDTKLIYYAKSTWYIAMSKIQKQLILENQTINWVPEHLRDGRFGEWLRDVKDWAFARERYWGTPLPIWQCTKCKNYECIGSVEELSKKSTLKPVKLILVRHGHSEHNDQEIYSDKVTDQYQLTDKGKKQISEVSKKLAKEKVAVIYSSDMLRTKQTAEILNKELKTTVKLDKRIREISFGKLYGKSVPTAEFQRINYYEDAFPEGESIAQVQTRVQDLFNELKEKYAGKTIALVSHENTIHAALVTCMKIGKDFVHQTEIKTGSYIETYIPEIENLHKPYIDEVSLDCEKCKGKMTRVEEVCDVWFDSGSAPFAQWHYPFENSDKIDKNTDYPADYISEAIDQTRGWFYTLLAVSTLLKKPASYKNVISLGHIRDKHGQKMSKSKGNVVNLEDIANKYGIDALRWYFFTVNQPGEYKNYDELDIQKNLKKNILILWNIYGFLVTYTKSQNIDLEYQKYPKPKHTLDKWMYSRLNSLISETKSSMDNYDVVSAARGLSDFINLFSTWYLRRSRKRFTANNPEAKDAMNHFYTILLDLCKILAPFTPFAVENIYQNIRSLDMPESIHLCSYPKSNSKLIDKKLEKQIDLTREICSLALSIRAEQGVKVRQPLESLYVNTKDEISPEILNMIKEEVNVQKIEIKSIPAKITTAQSKKFTKLAVGLNTHLTPELKKLGILAEIIRNIQSLRKQNNYKPDDKVKLQFSTNSNELQEIVTNNSTKIKEQNNLTSIDQSKSDKSLSQKVKIDNNTIELELIK